MKHSEIDQIKDDDFKRLVGVRKLTYLRMVEIHREALETDKKRKGFADQEHFVPRMKSCLL